MWPITTISNYMKIKVSAPGKLMLLGEHAVVYGYPCIVTAVDKRLYVQAEIINEEEDEIITPQVKESRFALESIAKFKSDIACIWSPKKYFSTPRLYIKFMLLGNNVIALLRVMSASL